jgi:hypothetical protein
MSNSTHHKVFDLVTGDLTQFENDGYPCMIGKDINEKFYIVKVYNNTLIIDNASYVIPKNIYTETTMYSVEMVNHKFVLLKLHNDFVKNWYILFDKCAKSYSSWIHLKSITDIQYLMKKNKVMIVYENMILILSTREFKSIFESNSIENLLVSIDKGCQSMVYHIDKNSAYCVNNDDSYVVYVNNNTLMATMTCVPYSMHICCKLRSEKVVHMKICYHEILLQYDDLSIDIVTF